MYPSGLMQFEVRKLQESFAVDVEKRSCTCRMWQLNGIGCVHSVAALAFLNFELDHPHVEPMYLAAFYGKSYNRSINGMNGSNMWHPTAYVPPLPPMRRRMPGRPTIKRRRDPYEKNGRHTLSKSRKSLRCGICKQLGHNRATCPTFNKPNSTKKSGKRGEKHSYTRISCR